MERTEIKVIRKRPPSGIYYCNLVTYVELLLGNKRLSLTIDNWGDHIRVDTRLSSRRLKRRLEGATTALYQRAHESMQNTCDNLEAPVVYQLRTNNRNMMSWAQDPQKGESVFEWDQIGSDRVFAFIGTFRISPSR